MPPLVRVRPENRDEAPALRGFIREAFRTARTCDGDEPEFVDRLRESPGYLPELALVAERGPQLVGHVMVTRLPMNILNGTALFLAELSVQLDVRGRGLGSGLVREALSRAASFGKSIFVVGEPSYYHRFGFVSASRFDLANANRIPPGNFMAMELTDGGLASAWGRITLPE